MEIKTLTLGDIRVNCYLLATKHAAAVIDPGYYSETAEKFLNENADKKRIILLTHAHFDHIGGAQELRKNTGVKIAIGEYENEFLSDESVNLSLLFGESTDIDSADILLKDGDSISLGDMNIRVIHTPGHTPGSVAYLIENTLFSGDTLFFESVGRTDFPKGSFKALEDSVRRLYSLDGNIRVLSGHGEPTTVSHEKMFNPFVNNRS